MCKTNFIKAAKNLRGIATAKMVEHWRASEKITILEAKQLFDCEFWVTQYYFLRLYSTLYMPRFNLGVKLRTVKVV